MTIKNTHLTGLAIAMASLAAPSQADLIFSEYIEGSSSNKAIELTNTGDADLSLDGYSIELYGNGETTPNNIEALTGTLAAGDVYVITNSSADSDIASQSDITSTVTFFNGNDVLVLKQGTTVIDRIGQVGNSANFGKDVTLVRKSTVTSGDANSDQSFDASAEWLSFEQDTFNYLGLTGETSRAAPSVSCGDASISIASVQGSGSTTPMADQEVTVTGVVTADHQGSSQMNGLFLQTPDADADGDASTSDGIFIYGGETDVSVGDSVIVKGTAEEYYDLTQISAAAIDICANGVALPTLTSVSLPLDSQDGLESVEGMRVTFDQTLTVNEVYQLGRYGEFVVADGRRFQPTEVSEPGSSEATDLADLNARNQITVDDGISSQNPDPVIFPSGNLSATNPLRIGDTLNNLTGVISYGYSKYRIIPTETLTLGGTNPREIAPETSIEGDLRIASFNVLNYFNGDGQGGGFPTDRGADNAEELERQEAKIIAALEAIDADIIGLMEIENDGFGEHSAIAQLVEKLNATQSETLQYDYVAPAGTSIGDDAIAVGMIYRPARVSLVNTAQILSSDNSPLDDNQEPLFIDTKNRPALAQSFEHTETGDRLTVVVNHFKSKGSSCDDIGDPEDPNGQGNCNQTRTKAAQALSQWLATDPTGVNDTDVLVIGDLNAYSMEDPVQTLVDDGYSSLKAEGEYSYVFDGKSGNLDHALASSSLSAKAVLVQDWHINTDEPSALDYNTEYKSEAQVVSFYAATPYRSSDHDPVVADFKMVTAADTDTGEDDEDKDDDKGGAFSPAGGIPGLFTSLILLTGLIRLRKK